MRRILRATVMIAMLIVSAIKSTIFAVLEVPATLIVMHYYYDDEIHEVMTYWGFVAETFRQVYIAYRDLIIEFING